MSPSKVLKICCASEVIKAGTKRLKAAELKCHVPRYSIEDTRKNQWLRYGPRSTISRFLCHGVVHAATAAIPLGLRLLAGSCNLPGSRNGAGRSCSPIWSCSTWGLPCQRALPRPRCALTAPFRPYLRCRRRYIFCGTFRKTRFERAPPAVSRHVALWRPDFPPTGMLPLRCAAAHLTRSIPIIM